MKWPNPSCPGHSSPGYPKAQIAGIPGKAGEGSHWCLLAPRGLLTRSVWSHMKGNPTGKKSPQTPQAPRIVTFGMLKPHTARSSSEIPLISCCLLVSITPSVPSCFCTDPEFSQQGREAKPLLFYLLVVISPAKSRYWRQK